MVGIQAPIERAALAIDEMLWEILGVTQILGNGMPMSQVKFSISLQVSCMQQRMGLVGLVFRDSFARASPCAYGPGRSNPTGPTLEWQKHLGVQNQLGLPILQKQGGIRNCSSYKACDSCDKFCKEHVRQLLKDSQHTREQAGFGQFRLIMSMWQTPERARSRNRP